MRKSIDTIDVDVRTEALPAIHRLVATPIDSGGSKIEPAAVTLLTHNISKAGVCFPTPRRFELGQVIEVEVTLPGVVTGGKDVTISSEGYVVGIEPGDKPGCYKLAAAFNQEPSKDESRWHKLVAEFEQPPASETDS